MFCDNKATVAHKSGAKHGGGNPSSSTKSNNPRSHGGNESKMHKTGASSSKPDPKVPKGSENLSAYLKRVENAKISPYASSPSGAGSGKGAKKVTRDGERAKTASSKTKPMPWRFDPKATSKDRATAGPDGNRKPATISEGVGSKPKTRANPRSMTSEVSVSASASKNSSSSVEGGDGSLHVGPLYVDLGGGGGGLGYGWGPRRWRGRRWPPHVRHRRRHWPRPIYRPGPLVIAGNMGKVEVSHIGPRMGGGRRSGGWGGGWRGGRGWRGPGVSLGLGVGLGGGPYYGGYYDDYYYDPYPYYRYPRRRRGLWGGIGILAQIKPVVDEKTTLKVGNEATAAFTVPEKDAAPDEVLLIGPMHGGGRGPSRYVQWGRHGTKYGYAKYGGRRGAELMASRQAKAAFMNGYRKDGRWRGPEEGGGYRGRWEGISASFAKCTEENAILPAEKTIDAPFPYPINAIVNPFGAPPPKAVNFF